MRTLDDLAYAFTIFAAPVVVVVVGVLLLVTRQRRRIVVATVVAGLLAAIAYMTYWWLWGRAFDYADSYRPVPSGLDVASEVAWRVCLAATLVVAVLGAARLRAHRLRPRIG